MGLENIYNGRKLRHELREYGAGAAFEKREGKLTPSEFEVFKKHRKMRGLMLRKLQYSNKSEANSFSACSLRIDERAKSCKVTTLRPLSEWTITANDYKSHELKKREGDHWFYYLKMNTSKGKDGYLRLDPKQRTEDDLLAFDDEMRRIIYMLLPPPEPLSVS